MNDIRKVLMVILLIIGFYLILDDDSDSKRTGTNLSKRRNSEKVKTKDILNQSNYHLSLTDRKINQQKVRTQVENESTAPIVQDYDKSVPAIEIDRSGVDMSIDLRGAELTERLGRGPIEFGMPKNPREIIHKELFDAEEERTLTESAKRQYAKEFIDNALKAGYVVKINSEFKVISVEPVRNPSSDEGGEDVLQKQTRGIH